jgi:hypothetical protein
MPKFQPKRQQQLQRQSFAHVVTNTDLSDLADASGVKHVLTAAARADAEQYHQMLLLLAMFSIDSAAGDDLDER